MAQLIHELIADAARRWPAASALRSRGLDCDFAALERDVTAAANCLLALGLQRMDRVAVIMEKREEAVLAMFGAAMAGCVFVPVNPLFKPDQVAHILRDSGARVLVTTPARLAALAGRMSRCPALHHVLVCGAQAGTLPGLNVQRWDDSLEHDPAPKRAGIEGDTVALVYTAVTGGQPKGVVLSHRNLLAAAEASCSMTQRGQQDRVLSLLPLSDSVGLAQLTATLMAGACSVLLNPLLMRDIPEVAERERVSEIAASGVLWMQLSELDWGRCSRLRQLTSCGAVAPDNAARLAQALPQATLCTVHGCSEAWVAAYLAPAPLGLPGAALGHAPPRSEVLVLAPDGRPCRPNEVGELVQRGPCVAQGYWNDAAATARAFRPVQGLAALPQAPSGFWSGELVRMDELGMLFHVGRKDGLIRTAGCLVDPAEVEGVVRATGLLAEQTEGVEVAVVGEPHPLLGQALVLRVLLADALGDRQIDGAAVLAACRARLPAYMVPGRVEVRVGMRVEVPVAAACEAAA